MNSNMHEKELKNRSIKKETSEKMLDEDNAYRVTKRLAFPRLTGSEGDKKAREIILEEFENAGYNLIYRDKFMTSSYNWNFVRMMFIIIGTTLLLMALSFYITPILSLSLALINIVITFKALSVSVSNKIKLSRNEKYNYETENFYVELKSQQSKAKVIFLGHWDSKSQSFSPSVRIIIFIISIFGGFILFLTYVILSLLRISINLNIPILNNILLDACIIIALIGVINYFNKTDNNSPGAFDNAAAVGTIIELARYYKNNPKKNIDLIFLSPGSEELNLGGAIHYIQKFKDKFDKNTTFFINLDFIGGSELIRLISSYGIPRRSSSKKLNRLFLESAERRDFKIKDIYAPTGVWSDYMPIVQEGFEACWLGSQPGIKYVHTEKDNMDLISKIGLKNILILCSDVINKLDEEYNQ
ncbi:MAG: M28 family peptidase [Promethearchaeota archaeon]|nr:MAG: M28 family peptidase [Candidatus Lokiarchaeota archaeon]